jgi:tetratricopeptide (TPR) repeat protein
MTCTANLARAYAARGSRNEALQLLGDLKQPHGSYSNASEIAMVYAALGDMDQAMTWLNRAYRERFNPSVLLRPGFDLLRADARFQDLERRVGLSR